MYKGHSSVAAPPQASSLLRGDRPGEEAKLRSRELASVHYQLFLYTYLTHIRTCMHAHTCAHTHTHTHTRAHTHTHTPTKVHLASQHEPHRFGQDDGGRPSIDKVHHEQREGGDGGEEELMSPG